MKATYSDLIDQTHYFPQDGFNLDRGYLLFNNLSLKYLIDKYGTPFKLIFLPKIGDQIKKARNIFNKSIKANDYAGNYYYCYCTKCNHFSFVIKEALKNGTHLETSSSYDLDIIHNLHNAGKVSKDIHLVHNGHKTDNYLKKINDIREAGLTNTIIVLDSMDELDKIPKFVKGTVKVGVRMAIDEEPQSAYYTSRMGIRQSEIVDFCKKKIKGKKGVELDMLHFFIDSGIKDTLYYWGIFQKALSIYAEIKKACPTLRAINLGGGLPIRNSLSFEYDYKYMINELVRNIKDMCVSEGIEEPDIYTEFGKYTVGESGCIVFKVLEVKQQNDAELWYIIDNSLMTTIPDAWGMFERFILLPVNKWGHEYSNVNIGGISCDSSDYYNVEDLNQQVYLPRITNKEKEPLYLGFFHTGAYQDSISGYGGIKHCLIPSPKTIVVDRNDKGQFEDYLFKDEQKVEDMLKILGYD